MKKLLLLFAVVVFTGCSKEGFTDNKSGCWLYDRSVYIIDTGEKWSTVRYEKCGYTWDELIESFREGMGTRYVIELDNGRYLFMQNKDSESGYLIEIVEFIPD